MPNATLDVKDSEREPCCHLRLDTNNGSCLTRQQIPGASLLQGEPKPTATETLVAVSHRFPPVWKTDPSLPQRARFSCAAAQLALQSRRRPTPHDMNRRHTFSSARLSAIDALSSDLAHAASKPRMANFCSRASRSFSQNRDRGGSVRRKQSGSGGSSGR